MKQKSLSVPENLLQDKTLTPAQKLILSAFSQKQKMYSLEIAKMLGTRRSTIQDDLQGLVNNQRLFESNGTGRVSYSIAKGLGFESREITNLNLEDVTQDVYTHLEDVSSLTCKTTPNFNNSLKQSLSKVIYVLEDKKTLAFHYWCESGGIRHREHTKVFNNCFDYLERLFTGSMFKDVPDGHLDNPLLAKKSCFELEDWMTSLDNYNLALTSPAHRPSNKAKAIAYRKKLSLPNYIYNPFNKSGNKSFFLQYLYPPKLITTELVKYKKLTQALITAFNDQNFKIEPTEDQIILAATMFGDLLKQYRVRMPSIFDMAKNLPEFIDDHFEGRLFRPRWMSATWFQVEFEQYLDRMGLINIQS